MNRKYTTEEYAKSCGYLRKYFREPAITTDVIVGFPGETEEEFAVTKQYLEKIHFYEMHIFKYSKRQGTKAAKMSDQIDEQIKTKRSNELLALEKKMSKEFRDAHIGKRCGLLCRIYKRVCKSSSPLRKRPFKLHGSRQDRRGIE